MNLSHLSKLLVPGAILFAIYKFVPDQRVKAMALGAAGAIVAKQLPYVSDVA